ncbi:hypothetical protein [Piscinibacter sp.]|uniref:hypothetical protein n=1 Tax=Piscinibacter sp. TaxID=1903157 RepID=UPI001D948C4E|nr:hypothetical protein [Piscinibacter sp.]MBK7532021.1 hypothetical protein [Piscinibacter sp.]
MTDSDVDPKDDAFFRWQEWMAFRCHMLPTFAEARHELYTAESTLLAVAGEHEAAADAERWGSFVPVTEEGAYLTPFPEGTEVAIGSVEESQEEGPALVPFERQEHLQQLTRRVMGLSPTRAKSLLVTIHALESTLAWRQSDPFRLRSTTWMAELGSLQKSPDIVVALALLRQDDPQRFRWLFGLIQQKAGTAATVDTLLVDWLKGSDLP